MCLSLVSFFFNDTATTEIYTLSLHDALPIYFVKNTDSFFNTLSVISYNSSIKTSMILITSLFKHVIFLALILIVLFILIYKKRFNKAVIFIIGIVGGVLLEEMIKEIIKRARPGNFLISVSGYSFPSGHAVMSTIFFFLIWYLFRKDIKNEYLKTAFFIVNVTLALLVDFSRIYLRVHWFSDVLGGVLLGIFWICILILYEGKISKKLIIWWK